MVSAESALSDIYLSLAADIRPVVIRHAFKADGLHFRQSLAACHCGFFALTIFLLQVVDLSRNAFTGSISPVFATLTQLRILRLGYNQFVGSLPAAFVSLRRLAADMSNNALNGPGPLPTGWRLMAGPGFQLQCLLLENNTDTLVTQQSITEYLEANKARVPPTGLAINDASNALCMLGR
jgi:hypothetical protein